MAFLARLCISGAKTVKALRRSKSVAVVLEAADSTDKSSFSEKILRSLEQSFLTPKLRFIKSQYGQRTAVNIGAVLVTVLCAGCFIFFFMSEYVAKAVTQYLSNVNSSVDDGRRLKTECHQVAKVVSEQFSLGSSGKWSTSKDYYTQQSVFTFTASDMQVDNEQFAEYMTAFDADLEEFRDTYLSNRSWSENLKRMLGYRWSTPNNEFQAEFDIDFNSLMNPTSYGAYFSTMCGGDFSEAGNWSNLNFDNGVYSYDRRLFAYSEMESSAEDDYLHFQWNFEVQEDAHSAKTALDGKYYIGNSPSLLPWNGTDTSSWKTSESTVEEVDMDGSDSARFRLTVSACPTGFDGRYTAGKLTCKISINKNLVVLAAALNDHYLWGTDSYIDIDAELLKITQYCYISRKFVTGDYIVRIDNAFCIVANGFLFAPWFNHYRSFCDYFYGDFCEQTWDVCYDNNFIVDLVELDVMYHSDWDNDGIYPFSYDNPSIDCKLFAPFYLGPASNDIVGSCTFDEFLGCRGYWLSDGWCDDINNNACCGYDGGDCCESTCVSSNYTCGSYGYACCETNPACESTCQFRRDDAQCPADDSYYYNDDDSSRRLSPKSEEKTVSLTELGRIVKKSMEKISDVMGVKEYEAIPLALRSQVSQASKKHKNAGLYDIYNMPEHNESPGLHSEPRMKTTLDNYLSGNGPKMTDNQRRKLVDIPMWYDISDIPAPSPSSPTSHYLDLHQPNTDSSHKYGYIKATSSDTDFMDSYMCYSNAMISQSGMCQSLCNDEYGTEFTDVNDDEGFYGGYMASALTFSLYEDLGQMLVDVGSGMMGFIMAKKIHFIDGMINGEVKIAGQVAVADFLNDSSLSDTEIGKQFGSFPLTQADAEDIGSQDSLLPCEPAACYCYERYRPYENVMLQLNTKTNKNFINSKYYEMGGLKAHCNDPYANLVVPTEPPLPLIESFFECESTTQMELGTVFGATIANVGSLQEAAMIMFIMLLTQLWFKCYLKKEVDSAVEDDDDFEMETRRLVTEVIMARKKCGGDIGAALVELVQSKYELKKTESFEEDKTREPSTMEVKADEKISEAQNNMSTGWESEDVQMTVVKIRSGIAAL